MAELKKQDPTWGPENEMKFIDGLGTHQSREHRIDRTQREWLAMYIATHKASPHRHHKIGVGGHIVFAGGRREGWEPGDTLPLAGALGEVPDGYDTSGPG